MRYIRPLTLALALACSLCLLCACQNSNPPEPGQTNTQVGTQYASSWVTGISKSAASENKTVADWLALCSTDERDGIGHYALRNTVENADGTSTHHLLLYRSATAYDATSFTVSFAEDGGLLTVTPTYTSSDASQYGYDLVYLCLTADNDLDLLVEMLVDGDYPGMIMTTTAEAITPDTFGAQSHE